jgi:Icc-related predicted phosphoesterase
VRILAAADLHGKQPIYEWLLGVIREQRVEALVLAGDLLGCPEGFDTPEKAQQDEACRLTGFLGMAAVPVLYIMGNDDLVELDPGAEPHSRSADGRYAAESSCSSVTNTRCPSWVVHLKSPRFRSRAT